MKIVLTGGPSAGKTSAVEIIHRCDDQHTVVVSEAASILFRGGFPRKSTADFIICQQRAIYSVQKELEQIAAISSPGKTLVCDRGSLDGLAYWPESEESFFHEIKSTMEEEIKRYDWVLHLDTASSHSYQSSEIRIEGLTEAQLINEKTKQAWRLHPQRIIVPNYSSFLKKMDRVQQILHMIEEGLSPLEINQALEVLPFFFKP